MIVDYVLSYQLLVATRFNYTSIFKHNDPWSSLQRKWMVRQKHDCSILHLLEHSEYRFLYFYPSFIVIDTWGYIFD